MDYIAATSNNYGYALAIEQLLGIEAPRRAEIIDYVISNEYISHSLVHNSRTEMLVQCQFSYTVLEKENMQWT